MCDRDVISVVSVPLSVSEAVELSATVDVERGIPEKEGTPPPVDPGQYLRQFVPSY